MARRLRRVVPLAFVLVFAFSLLVTMLGCSRGYQTKVELPANLVQLAERELQEAYDKYGMGQNQMPGSKRSRPKTGEVMFVYPDEDNYLAWLAFSGYGNVFCYFVNQDGDDWTFVALDSVFESNYALPEPFTGAWTAEAEIPKQAAEAPDFLWGMVGSDKTTEVRLQNALYDCSIPGGEAYIENGYYVVPFKHGALFYVEVVFEDSSGNALKTIECKGASTSP